MQLLGFLADGSLRGGSGPPSLTAWSLYPPVVISLSLLGGLYAIGWSRLRSHARRSLLPEWRAWCFTAALLTIWVALLSPIGTLADYFLFAHMIEHLLLIMVVPPLFLLGAPLLVVLWALPYQARKSVGRWIARGSGLRRFADALTLPAVAAGIYVGTIAIWHLPLLYDLAEGTTIMHETEHLCFLSAGLLYWWPIIQPAGGRSRLSKGASLLHLVPGHLELLILGVFLTFTPGPIYGYYAAPVSQWHLSPGADQQLAGLIMWVAGGVVWTIEAGVVFIAWYYEEERREAPDRLLLAFQSAYPAIAGWSGVAPQRWPEQYRLATELADQRPKGVAERTLGGMLWGVGVVFLATGERARAEETWQRLDELANRGREPTALVRLLQARAFGAAVEGRLEESLQLAQTLRERAEEMDHAGLGRRLAISVRQRPLIRMGRFNEALAELDEIPGGTFVDLGRILCLAHIGRADEAAAAIERFRASNGIGEEEDETSSVFLAMLLEASLLIEDRQNATVLARRLEPLAGLASTQENTVCVGRLLGGAAALRGERERARAYYERALGAAARAGNRPEAALTHLQLGALLLNDGEGGPQHLEGFEHLDFAIAECRAMEMRPAVELALGCDRVS